MSYSYIASPYSHSDPKVRLHRYNAVLEFTAYLLRHRHWCYSPIVHCHHIALGHELPGDFDFWQDYNSAMLERSNHLIVLALDGWIDSRGVKGEMEMGRALGLGITYMRFEGDHIEDHSNGDLAARLADARGGFVHLQWA